MQTSDSSNTTTGGKPTRQPPPRPARSKNGCTTCRRRKVRCDEQQPRCSHCERLNLQCRWRPAYNPATQWRFQVVGAQPSSVTPVGSQNGHSPAGRVVEAAIQDPKNSNKGVGNGDNDSPATLPGTLTWPQNPGEFDQLFDYASFMWEAGGELMGQPFSSPERPRFNFGSCSGGDWTDQWTNIGAQSAPTLNASTTISTAPQNKQRGSRGLSASPANAFAQSSSTAAGPQISGDHDLINYFVNAVVPPILAAVETQKRWSSMRQMLISMSNASNMVKCAILAFSNLLYYRRETPWVQYPQHHYEAALDELATSGDSSLLESQAGLREKVLATLFFLTYVDILEDRVDNAHAHLKRAYGIFNQGNKRGFRPVEIRLLSWLRLLDARAVSAGGDGLFLSDTSEALITHPSPTASVEDAEKEGGVEEVKDWDIEDVLFQVLYHPGIVFFQKVQSFMGRISKIDPWHRSRGTIEDETEVMVIASRILKDLRDLYDERPSLMDPAVEGQLTAPHISATLAIAITRAFRTYLSNYHASKVHLHRVAYKHLPLSRDTQEALAQIRRLTRLLVDSLEPDRALPVSQLWPLLMLGSEEEDVGEREWIKEQILRMEKVATNARITAHVLEEVQARQDASKSRVDIRSVMHAIFDSCFAIM